MKNGHQHLLPGLAAVILGGLIVASCATHVEGLKTDPSFTYAAVVSNNLMVGGVTSALTTLPPAERNRSGGILRREFLDEREDIRVLPAGTLAQSLGTDAYNALLDDYRLYGQLSETRLGDLRNKVKDARYLIFARIESDEIENERTESSVYDKKGKVVEDKKKIKLCTKRTVSASMNIYDLTTGIQAWSGTVEKYDSRSREFETSEYEWTADLAEVIMEGVTGEDIERSKPGFPAPPSMDKMMARVFEGFAENLPEKE